MLRTITMSLLAVMASISLLAQTGCPGCIVNLPTDLPSDTIYLDTIANGRVGEVYEEDLSFRLPMSTTPVNMIDPDTPAGIDINNITIIGVVGVPTGLQWEASATSFAVQDMETDGCFRLCGVPLVAGDYIMEVIIEAQIAIFAQQTTVNFPIHIDPPQTVTEGFTIVNASGCGSIVASFENNIPSNGRDGFSYIWNFGNGQESALEFPAPRRYTVPGVYTVEYQAIIDTIGFILTDISIDASPCTDLFTAPDMKFDLFDPEGERVLTGPIADNTNAPVVFSNLLIQLDQEGDYTLEIVDDDGGLDGRDELCGTIIFNRTANGVQTDGDLQVTLTIINPIDTLNFSEEIEVFPIPADPIISISDDPPYCSGETVDLLASYSNGLTWYRDSMIILGVDTDTLATSEAGEYWVTYTSPDGCMATAMPFDLAFSPLPSSFSLQQSGNLIRIVDETVLPSAFTFDWLYEGQSIIEATELLLCADVAGTYTLVITDSDTGCSREASIDANYDPQTSCTTSTYSPGGEVAWSVYPTPFQNYLMIEGPAVGRNIRMDIFSASGQLVTHFLVTNERQEIVLYELPKGAYFYRIVEDGQQLVQSGSLLKL